MSEFTPASPADAARAAAPAAQPPRRRRRSDAQRSIGAILDAARVVLSERPEASMEEIAATAGVTRQTVYAHFPSRDALVAGLVEAAAAEYAVMLDEADLDAAPAAEALARFLDVSWRFVDRYPLLMNAAASRIPRPHNDPHDFTPPRLERLISRGQREGAFDPEPPAAWLSAAVFGLQHSAVAMIASGAVTAREAEALCLESTLRLCARSGCVRGEMP